ncbi:hypothetical protein EYC84_011039 [Monilinia fructicola]|uniref:Uncharacterized protein n=1 Tax=Monilinia fructicola TaxID=38448 RepID=A0A5M9J6X4_MONFR|nr:hypothetical protein EYC84_011039 [Monilinia fructicola]
MSSKRIIQEATSLLSKPRPGKSSFAICPRSSQRYVHQKYKIASNDSFEFKDETDSATTPSTIDYAKACRDWW